MSIAATLKIQMQVGGAPEIAGQIDLTASSSVPMTQIALSGAKSGALTTRTDNDTGELTMDAGHGFATSDLIDLAWAGGARRGMVATVDGNAVDVDGGAGDNLPADETELYASKQTTVNVDFSGTNLKMIGVHSTKRAQVDFQQEDNTSLKAYDVAAGVLVPWAVGMGTTTPLAGAVGKVVASSSDPDGGTLTILGLFDSLA